MAYRRRRQLSLPDHSDGHRPNNMDQLALKYMEMCKVESSTDSDSEISPRWSDTSTMVFQNGNITHTLSTSDDVNQYSIHSKWLKGCVSSAPESETFGRILPLTHKPAGRHGCYSLFLDPYDGSSEDSDKSDVDMGVPSRRTRQPGRGGGGGSGCRFSGRSRRLILHHPASLREVVKNGMRDHETEPDCLLDVQMKCGGDSELWVCELDLMPSHRAQEGCGDLKEEMANDSTTHAQTMDVELHCQFDDSGLHATRSSTPQTAGASTPVDGSSSQRLGSSSERSQSPCHLRPLYKRKLGFPGVEAVELVQRKRQCVVNMEEEQEGGESVSEPCMNH